MQEEITQKTLALCVEASKMTAQLLQQAMKKVLADMEKHKKNPQLRHGKQTLRQLMKHNTGVSNIEITDQNSVTGITLFLSAISKNQIVALVAAMAIFLFPVLLPITEVNPLFRLVGLLPIYHVLAISLLSVEQMSNGMLYAIWAIPAALLFLGVGAGISRRVFAKHQVL